MSSNRWVAIDPDILNHPLVGAGQPVAPADPTRGAYSRMEAWVWIICNGSFADHTIINRGRKMTLQRGDVLGAYAFLAYTFNWSSKTVRVWIDKLIADEMLARRAIEEQTLNQLVEQPEEVSSSGNQATVLAIVNYWRYQFGAHEERTPQGNQKGNHQGNQQGNQSGELSVSEIADKYVLQQQQGQALGQAEGQAKGQHITINNNYPLPSNNEPLSEVPSDDEKPKRTRKQVSYSEAFEAFWQAYPDRTNNSKPKAFQEWERLTEPDQNAATASLPTFTAYCRKHKDYRCVHAERYLSQRRWESHMPQTAAAPWWRDPEKLRLLDDDRWRAGISAHANGTWPVDKLGPPPGHRDCKVPRHLLDELRLTEVYSPAGLKLN